MTHIFSKIFTSAAVILTSYCSACLLRRRTTISIPRNESESFRRRRPQRNKWRQAATKYRKIGLKLYRGYGGGVDLTPLLLTPRLCICSWNIFGRLIICVGQQPTTPPGFCCRDYHWSWSVTELIGHCSDIINSTTIMVSISRKLKYCRNAVMGPGNFKLMQNIIQRHISDHDSENGRKLQNIMLRYDPTHHKQDQGSKTRHRHQWHNWYSNFLFEF